MTRSWWMSGAMRSPANVHDAVVPLVPRGRVVPGVGDARRPVRCAAPRPTQPSPASRTGSACATSSAMPAQAATVEPVVVEDADRDVVDAQGALGLVDDGPEQLLAIVRRRQPLGDAQDGSRGARRARLRVRRGRAQRRPEGRLTRSIGRVATRVGRLRGDGPIQGRPWRSADRGAAGARSSARWWHPSSVVPLHHKYHARAGTEVLCPQWRCGVVWSSAGSAAPPAAASPGGVGRAVLRG